MKTSLLATVAVFAASVAAFAFPSSSDPLCTSTCSPFMSDMSNCGYDLTSSDNPTTGQVNCMCKTSGFTSAYQNCYNCLNDAGLVSASESASTQAIKDACASVGASSGAISLTPGSVGIMAGLFVSVGLGFCGIAV